MASLGKIFGAIGKLFGRAGTTAEDFENKPFGGKKQGKQFRHHPKLEAQLRRNPRLVAQVFGSSVPTSETPAAVEKIRDSHAEDLFKQQEAGPQDKYYSSDLERFLDGIIVHVDSTHVEWVQWVRDVQTLYIGYHGGKGVGVIAVYQYFEISEAEAESIYNSGSHTGTKVWDDLRVRGTVFGHQKSYSIVAASNATYAAGFGGYHPKYLQDPRWEQQHANIPASGAIPPEWFAGLGPYEKAWLARAHGGESNIPVNTGDAKPAFKPSGKRQRSQRGKGKNPWWYGG